MASQGLSLYFHGGECCGVKTIAGFPCYPKSDHAYGEKHIAYRLSALGKVRNNDSNGSSVSSSKPFFTDEAPQESVEERFERLVAFCKKRRPKGCIEVCLARTPYGDWDQNKLWWPLLEKHGFKETVPEFLNSNSQNWVTIYHLVYDITKEVVPSAANAATTPNPFERT